VLYEEALTMNVEQDQSSSGLSLVHW